MANIVVADAGPLHYLILVGCADVLGQIFDHVLIPFAVQDELSHSNTPLKVRDWLRQPRPWLEVVAVRNPSSVSGLHHGETQALQLSLQARAPAVLMDDLDGRAAARRLGLKVVGTVGLLEMGAQKRLLDLPEAIAALRQTSFFVSDEILNAALERDRQRRGR